MSDELVMCLGRFFFAMIAIGFVGIAVTFIVWFGWGDW